MYKEKNTLTFNASGTRCMIQEKYTEELAGDFKMLSEMLGIPLTVLNGWRRHDEHDSGWLSCPVTLHEYSILLIIANYVWGNQHLLRIQLSHLEKTRRDNLVRDAGMKWVERVVLEDLLIRKLNGERRHVQFRWYQQYFQGRYPNAYQQLTSTILSKMAKKAGDIIRSSKKTGKYEELVESLGFAIIDGKIVKQSIRKSPMPPLDRITVPEPGTEAEDSGEIHDVVESVDSEMQTGNEHPSNENCDNSIREEWLVFFTYNYLMHQANLEKKRKELKKSHDLEDKRNSAEENALEKGYVNKFTLVRNKFIVFLFCR